MNLRDTRTSKRDAAIAKALGVTPVGLVVLARMVANKGVGRTAGMAGRKLLKQGYISEPGRNFGSYEPASITDAGREVVRRARAMGW